MAPEAGLSRATFAKLSPHPYLLANLEPSNTFLPPARSNGRTPFQVRDPIVNLSSLSYAHGSALVRTGDTTAICGVRGETILARHIPSFREDNTQTELADYDLLVPNIELATGCAPPFLPGVPPTTLAQTLSTRIYSLLHSTKLVQPADLRIWHKRPAEKPVTDDDNDDDAMKDNEDDDDDDDDDNDNDDDSEDREGKEHVVAYWVLYIDIFFISFDGNPFDAAWAAVLAALRDTKLPRARYDPDRELVVCSRADPPRPLTIEKTPIACTAVVFTGKETDADTDGRHWLLADPDTLEESLCKEGVTVVVDCGGGSTQLLSVSKHGGTLLGAKTLRSAEFLGWAARRWEGFVSAMQATSQ